MDGAARQIYIISDLHLGGEAPATTNAEDRGFRINTHVSDVAAFVRAIAQKTAPVELVINGDLVDFLAEKTPGDHCWTPFTSDPQVAANKFDAIAAREKIFFDALGEFLNRGHKLTILLGNHDIELAFPAVRKRLVAAIGVRGNHDYQLVYTNEAHTPGDALIEHGNRYDDFNEIDYGRLRELCSLQSRRQLRHGIEISIPPGSKMVADVINPIKEHYRFVDLLKPENGAVIPMLLALEPACRALLLKAVEFKRQASKFATLAAATPDRYSDILPSRPVATPQPSEPDALDHLLTHRMGEHFHKFTAGIKHFEAQIGSDLSGVSSSLGLMRLLFTTGDSSYFENRLPALLAAIRSLAADRTFDRNVETAPEYLHAAETLASEGDFRYIVFGHTHLPKKVALKTKPGAFYLNTGTWVDLIRFPEDKLAGPEAIDCVRQFCSDLKDGFLSPWIHYEPVFARIDLDAQDRVIEADLYTWTGPGSV